MAMAASESHPPYPHSLNLSTLTGSGSNCCYLTTCDSYIHRSINLAEKAETISPIGIADSNLNMDSAPKPPKQTKGRMKIPIKKIQNKNKKHVTFSKRRNGLFKKATELCVLCGASVAVITFSEAGKVFTFGHPSTDAVIHRYLHGAAPSSPAIEDHDDHWKPYWRDRPVEELGFEELESYAASLEQIKSNVERRIADLDLEYQLKLNAVVKTDFDYEQRPIPSNRMNNYYSFNGVGGVDPAISFGSPDFAPVPPPPVGQNQDDHHQYHQYCGCGCMGDDYGDISSIISLAKFNRSSGLGFGEY